MPTIEICVESSGSALAAEQGGAHRVELCSRLDVGGTTPSASLIERTRKTIRIPLHVMIRPRGGNFVYSENEFASMKNEIGMAKAEGVNGVVLGILRGDGSIDVERTRELVSLAAPMSVTFHRAFDQAIDPLSAIEDVIASGAARLLTSGQAKSAVDGIALISALSEISRGRLKIIAAAGIVPKDVGRILKAGRIGEIHVATAARNPSTGETEANLVRAIVSAANTIA